MWTVASSDEYIARAVIYFKTSREILRTGSCKHVLNFCYHVAHSKTKKCCTFNHCSQRGNQKSTLVKNVIRRNYKFKKKLVLYIDNMGSIKL